MAIPPAPPTPVTPPPDPAPAPPAPAPTPPTPAPSTPPTPAPRPAPTPSPSTPGTTPPNVETPLGEAGIRALVAEREARAAAERDAREARAEAERDRQLAATAGVTLQRANMITSLAARGIVGPRAEAAIRLLDGITYDANHTPTNLDASLQAAMAAYGPEMFTAGATPTPPPYVAPGATPAPVPSPYVPPAVPLPQPVLHPAYQHQGPRATPTPDEDAQFAAYMNQNFPGVLPQPPT